jgi:coproporphyrinogen III oxidase
MIDSQAVRDYLLGLQDRITDAIAAVDGQAFLTDNWEKPPPSACAAVAARASWRAAP